MAKTLKIAFSRKNLRIQVLANFLGFIIAYGKILTLLSRLIFAFAIFELLISNVLMVGEEELFMKSPKLR